MTHKLLTTAFLFAALLRCEPALAQYTPVAGTIVDPNGVPYAGAIVSAQLTSPGATLTISDAAKCTSSGFGSAPCHVPIPGTVGPVTAGSDGSFTLSVPDNALILPASTKWAFTVRITPGVPPPFGTGGQSIGPTAATTITITGSSTQNISSTLNAAAPALTVTFSGTGNVTSAGSLASGNVVTGAGSKAVQDSGVALSSLSTLASPALTGTPTAPTATLGDNTTQIATDAFVQTAIGTREQLLSVNTTPVTANTSTTAFQPLQAASSAIAAGALNALNKTIRIRGAGSFTPSATQTVALQIQLAPPSLAAGTAAGSSFGATNTTAGSWFADETCTVTTAGASGVLTCQGTISYSQGAPPTNSAASPFSVTSVTVINLTASITPTFQVSFGLASVSNTMTQNFLSVEQLN